MVSGGELDPHLTGSVLVEIEGYRCATHEDDGHIQRAEGLATRRSISTLVSATSRLQADFSIGCVPLGTSFARCRRLRAPVAVCGAARGGLEVVHTYSETTLCTTKSGR